MIRNSQARPKNDALRPASNSATEHPMRAAIPSLARLRSPAALLAGIVVAFAPPSGAAPLCTPDLAITSTQLSDMRAAQRTWTARIAVDASQCATASGRFFIRFVRLKEIGPDRSEEHTSEL